MLPYLLFVPLLIYLIYYSFLEQTQTKEIKRNGIRTVGTIILNRESGAKSFYRLGGNINHPTIKFITAEGKEVIGEPIAAFISQHEVVVPSTIYIIYDLRNPERFCIDGS